MGTLVFQATLGGQVNLTGPNTSSTFTINVPAVSGTMGAFSSLTSNGVAYVNGSGQPTSGSALTFDGTNLGVGGAVNAIAGFTSVNINGGASGSFTDYKVNGTLESRILALPSELRVQNITNGTIGFYTNSSEQMRLTSTGLGIGTSSPASKLDVSSSGEISRFRTSTARGSGNGYFGFYDPTGRKGYYGYGGGDDSLYIANEMNAPMLFITNSSERARIDSSGNFLVGTTTSSVPTDQSFQFIKSAGACRFNHSTANPSGDQFAGFFYNGSGIGSITQSGTTAVLYNITSDQRLKENIQDADSASSLIDALQVRKFDWKTDNTHQRYGFVAQELITVAPEAVHQPANEDEMMAVDYSKLVPMLVKEIQSLRQRVAQLESN